MMSNGSTISGLIEKAVGDFVMETNLEPTKVYISNDAWYQLLEDFLYMSNSYKNVTHATSLFGMHSVSFITIYGNITVIAKDDIPNGKIVCNPEEYKKWLNDTFEKEILIREDE